MPLSAWGSFGEPPFPDIGGGVAQRLRSTDSSEQRRALAGQQRGSTREAGGSGETSEDIGGGVAQQLRSLAGQQAQLGEAGEEAAHRSEEQQRSGETLEALGSPPFCIGILKLTPEKGCSIVFELARRLPHRRYGRELQRDRSRAAALYPYPCLGGCRTLGQGKGGFAAPTLFTSYCSFHCIPLHLCAGSWQ